MRGYQYETSPKKLEPEFIPNKKQIKSRKNKAEVKKEINQKIQARRLEFQKKRDLILFIALVFSALLFVSYRNSLITESFSQLKGLKTELSTLQKDNQQTEALIESSINLAKIEQEAQTRLGMQKLSNEQKVYVNLDKKDYVESATNGLQIASNSSWFQNVLNKIMGK